MRHSWRWALGAMALACSAVLVRADEAMLFNVPKAPAATLEQLGERTDWGMPVTGLIGSSVRDAQQNRPAASYRLGWDKQGLIVMADVTDTTPDEAKAIDQLYSRDSLELFVAPADRPEYRFQLVIAPGRTDVSKEVRVNVVDHRGENQPAIAYETIRVPRTDGYKLVVRIPFAALGVKAESGQRLLMQLCVNDGDGAEKRRQWVWYPSTETWRDAQAMYRIRLANRSDDRAEVGAIGGYRGFRGAQVLVQTPASLAGQIVELRNDGKALGIGYIKRDEDRGLARVRLPMPMAQKPYGKLTVVVDGQPAATASLPEMPNAESTLGEAQFGPEKCIFWETPFPSCDFERPDDVEDVIGSYTVKTTYYDAELNPVTTATKPGRYGAVSQITGEDGKTFIRYNVLYRTPEKPKMNRMSRFDMQVTLPAEFGIDPAVSQREGSYLADEFTWAFRKTTSRNDGWAAVLATMAEMKADGPKSVGRTGPWGVSDDYIARLQIKVEDFRYRYAVSLPKDYTQEGGTKYPLILFLHGSGERGTDLKAVERHGPVQFVREHDLPFIVISPQCPSNQWWMTMHLDRTLNEVVAKYPVDSKRIYVTGLSMGGYGTWGLIMAYPRRFAAAAPICGIGDAEDMARISDLPTWVFHGDKDDVVPYEEDVKCVQALKKAHGRVRFTSYPGVGHDSWTATYRNPEFYTWMLQQKLGEPQEPNVP